MFRLPATLPERPMPPGQRCDLKLTQREVDILFDALGHHEVLARTGQHLDAYGRDAVQRWMGQFADRAKLLHDSFDPYRGYSAKMREFARDLDLWTLEEVIIRVLTHLDRRREKYLGGHKGMMERDKARWERQQQAKGGADA